MILFFEMFFNVFMPLGVYEKKSFKLGLMIYTSKLNSAIPVPLLPGKMIYTSKLNSAIPVPLLPGKMIYTSKLNSAIPVIAR